MIAGICDKCNDKTRQGDAPGDERTGVEVGELGEVQGNFQEETFKLGLEE